MTRPTILQTLATVAQAWALRSTCSRRHVGAVIADERGVILSSGYNGAPAGMEHCDHECDQGCQDPTTYPEEGLHWPDCSKLQSCTTAVHAEENAIVFAARRGVSVEGAQIVTTYGPCHRCARMVVQAGIVSVAYLEKNPDPQALELFNRAGTTLLSISPKE